MDMLPKHEDIVHFEYDVVGDHGWDEEDRVAEETSHLRGENVGDQGTVKANEIGR